MDHRIRKVLAAVETDLAAERDVGAVARSVNLSASRLQHLFKSETGMSLSEYRLRLRMERARGLLETTHLSVKQVACDVGAPDLSHFIKNFKKLHGVTPKRYRELFHSKAAAAGSADT